MHRLAPEIALIQSPEVRKFVEAALKKAPVYFWVVPSSMSGKHHPVDERGPGGRVLHAKRVARLCHELARTFDLPVGETDVLVAAGIIHDLVVNGQGDTPMNHNWRLHDVALRGHLKDLAEILPEAVWEVLMRVCEGHMGRWASSPTLTPEPYETGYLLHLADVIASREWVLIEPLG